MISQSNTIDKQKELLKAALKLFVAYGFHGTPTSKIAAEARVANGTLFHYYKTKDELVVALYIEIKKKLGDYLTAKISREDDVAACLKNMFTHSILWALAHRDEFYFIQQFHFSPHMSQVSREEIEKQTQFHICLLTDALRSGVIKPMPVDLLFAICSSHVFGIYQYLAQTTITPAKQKKIINEAFGILWDALKI